VCQWTTPQSQASLLDVSAEGFLQLALQIGEIAPSGQIDAEIDFSQSGLGQQNLTFRRLINIAGFTNKTINPATFRIPAKSDDGPQAGF